MRGKPGATDAEMLRVLDLRAKGLTIVRIAKLVGWHKAKVQRVLADTTVAPDRHDGTMPEGWWKDGLERPGRAPR